MNSQIRWGILGTGKIARQFALGLKQLPDARLTAVGSRTVAAAAAFGSEHAVTRCHGSYVDLVQDPEVDVIYVATPHHCHRENTLQALAAGKPVLCEKPFTINAREAEEVIAFARSLKLFLMEAMWTRFFPLMERLRAMLAAGTLGEIATLTADFGFRAEYADEPRLFDRSMGGGALLDVGIYPISFASMLFGAPSRIQSEARLGPTGVDEVGAFLLSHDQGALALLSTAIRAETAQEAVIVGSRGRLRIHCPWWKASVMTLSRENQPDEIIECPYAGNGYQFEAAEVMRCLRAKKLESPVMPLDETLALMRTLDTLRAQWSLKYPMDS